METFTFCPVRCDSTDQTVSLTFSGPKNKNVNRCFRTPGLSPDPIAQASPINSIQLPPASITQFGNSSELPGGISQNVLWTFRDCKADPTVGLTTYNPSRPNMRMALRNKDGSNIEQSVYDLIRSSAVSIVNTILLPLKPNNFPKGGKLARYFQLNNMPEWTNAVLQLEKLHPLVALCAEHWKAKHILQAVLRNKKDGPSNDMDYDDDENVDDEDPVEHEFGGSEQPSKRRRAQSTGTAGQSRCKRPKPAKAPNHSSQRKFDILPISTIILIMSFPSNIR